LENNPKILAAILAIIVGFFSKNIIATIFTGLISYWILIFFFFNKI
jgi:branched-subunit amino acid transport protein